MEHSLENSKIITTSEFEEVRKKTEVIGNVEQVYLSKKTEEGQIMTFLVKEDFISDHQDDVIKISIIMEILPKTKYRIYRHSYARKELEKGNLYFIKNCQLGNLVYNRSNFVNFNYQEENKTELLLKKATTLFEEEIDRIHSFTDGIKFYRKRREWAAAAFLIHQKIEWLYRCMENFAMGKSLVCHKIQSHLLYAHSFIYGTRPIFNASRGSDSQLLEVIDRAYSESRYHSDFEITEEEIKVLLARADLLESQVKEIFKSLWDNCYKLLTKENSLCRFSEEKESMPFYEEENDRDVLKKIILQELNVLKIISFGKRTGFRERQSLTGNSERLCFKHYDLLIITANSTDLNPIQIAQQISDSTEGKITATIIVSSITNTKKALRNGSVFLYRALKEGVQIYSNSEITFEFPPPSIGPAEQLEKIQRDYFYRQHRASCFLAASGEVAGDDDATEISLQYQALQQICLGSIYVILGLRPDCVKLEYLLDLCGNFSNAPDDCFPRRSKEDRCLLKKLTSSLNEVRFRTSDRRTLVDVDILFSRSEYFINEMKLISEKRIEEMEINLEQQNHEL